jgi:hypothetical protein
MQRTSNGKVATADELEADADRLSACIERVRAVVKQMREGNLNTVKIAKDAAYKRCYEAAKTWSRSVEDGRDEAYGLGPVPPERKKGRKR